MLNVKVSNRGLTTRLTLDSQPDLLVLSLSVFSKCPKLGFAFTDIKPS